MDADGETLDRRLAKGAPPLPRVTEIAIAIATALDELHRAGRAHGDLRPATIVLTRGGARLAGDGVARGDAAADLRAFGAVLQRLLAGRAPAGGLDAVARSCLAEDPDGRWQSAGDLARHLRGLRAWGQPRAAPPSSWPRILAGALAGAIAAGVVVWSRPAPRASPRPVARFDHTIPEGHELRNPHVPFLAVSADGRQLVYNTTAGLYLRGMNDVEPRLIPGTEEDLSAPFFSPDGGWIGYFAAGELKTIPVGGGAATVLCKAGGPSGADWGRDGTIVFGQEDGVRRVAERGGAPVTVLETRAGERAYDPQLLPGGEWLLVTLAEVQRHPRWDQARIVARSLRSGEQRLLWTGGSQARYVPTGHLVFVVEDVLHAVALDLDAMKVAGAPVPMVKGLQRAVHPRDRGSGFASFGFSDDGTLVYARSWGVTRDRVLALVDRDGAIQRLDVPPAPYAAPRVSPDGRRIAVQTLDRGRVEAWSGDVWVYDLDGKQQIRQLTLDGTSHDPIWTPDGKRVTYRSERDGRPGLYWQPVDGGPAERLTTAGEGTWHRPDSWSAAGPTLAFSIHRTSGTESSLWTLTPGSRDGPRRFHGVAGSWQLQAAFSPDGRWLAYVSSETGRPEVYLQPFPATGETIRVTQGGGVHPMWSPDGRELFYRRSFDAQLHRSTGAALLAVPVSTQAGVSFGAERRLPLEGFLVSSSYRDHDVTPDGTRFVMVYPRTRRPDPVRIGIVQGWFEELRERAPGSAGR